jgi:plastocyanin
MTNRRVRTWAVVLAAVIPPLLSGLAVPRTWAQTVCRTGNCATSPPSACQNRAAPYTLTVTMTGFAFDLTDPRIEPGDCVTWENLASFTHSSAEDGCQDDGVGNSCQSAPSAACDWDTGNLPTGSPRATCSYAPPAFPQNTGWGFYCRQHDSPSHTGSMHGTLRVTTPIVLSLARSGADVVLTWSGGDPAWKILRSTSDPQFNAANTVMLPGAGSAASPFQDTGEAGRPEPRFYLVRNKQSNEP